jgi:hypothetical protein
MSTDFQNKAVKHASLLTNQVTRRVQPQLTLIKVLRALRSARELLLPTSYIPKSYIGIQSFIG